MKLETSILVIPIEPSEKAWQGLRRFADRWNETHVHPAINSGPMMLNLRFPESSHPERREAADALQRLQETVPSQIIESQQRIYDATDYATADFVEISGASLDETPANRLVLNADRILTVEPCPQCGYCDAFDVVQKGSFRIDETQFERLTADGSRPPAGGWDFIEIAGGSKLVSSRFVSVVRDNRIQGYTLVPVLVGGGNQPSQRLWQLRANRAIVCPCPEHTRAIDGYFCPTCGAAHCDVEDEDWVRSDSVGPDEIFSRHRQHTAIIYVSGRLLQALVKAGLQQIKFGRIFRLCVHG